jgi:eukaryotic-like serine/threonine-protein kinase
VFPHLEIGDALPCALPGLEVFRARDLVSESTVRLILVPEEMMRAKGGTSEWEQYYSALKQLNHPHIARILDFGDLGDRFYVMLRDEGGETLTTVGESLSIDLWEILVRQIDDAVASARAVGVPLALRFSEILVSGDHRRATVLPMLDADGGSAPPVSAGAARHLEPGKTLAHYTIIDKIGEGGFAEVWLAQQEEPVHRQVALKVIKEGMDTRRVLARFAAERQALALLQHPYIARIYDAGSTDTGRPYFVMEAVDGQPIDGYCHKTEAPLKTRLRLVMGVCQAVQHAHHKGIIHRDLKPSNILVTEVGGEAVPKVIDFGIAKAVDQSLTDHTVYTRGQQVLGTPDYMSPEQMTSGGKAADSRSDVYSLGVLLYELLTGSTPFQLNEQTEAPGTVPWQRKSWDREVPKPSTRLAAEREARPHRPGWTRSREKFPRELDWIVLRALERDPERRYQSPDQLGEDLRRFLENEAVEAGPPTRAYQIQKFVRRHRAAVGGAAVAAVALLLGMGLALAGWLKAEEEKQRAVASEEAAQQEAEISEAVNAFLRNDLLGRANPYVSGEEREVTLREAVDRAAAVVDERFADKPEVLASLHYTLSDTYKGLSRYQEAEHHARRMAAVAEKHYGSEHLTTIAANSLLARILADSSQFAAALALHQKVLALKRVVLGEEHASTLRTRTRIAKIQGDLGNREEAEQEIREVLAIQERVLEKDHENTLSTLGTLAEFLFDQRSSEEREEALKLAREKLERSEGKWGSDHLITDGAENTLAVMLDESGKPEEAEPLHRRVLERRRAIFGAKHDATLISMSNLASALKNLGRLDEALSIYEESSPLAKEVLGVRNMTTLAVLYNFGTTLHAVGNHAEALSQLQEVFTVGSEILGENHPKMLSTQMFLGDCQFQLGNVAEAIRNYQHVVPASREAMGATHPEVILRGNNLAWYLGKAGRHAEAEPVWQAVCAAAEEAFADQPARLAKHLSNYGWSLREQEKFAESIPILKRVENLYRDALGADDKRTKVARLDWLTSCRLAGEPLTQAQVQEAFHLFKEVNGQEMGDHYREMQEKERSEAESGKLEEATEGSADGSARSAQP